MLVGHVPIHSYPYPHILTRLPIYSFLPISYMHHPNPSVLSAQLLILPQLKASLMQPPQRLLPIPRQIRSPRRRQRARKKPRPPLLPLLLPLRRLLSLALLNLLLERSSEGVLFIDDGVGDALPEFAGLVGELLGDWGYEFGDGGEGV